MPSARADHAAVVLPDGMVLVAGGDTVDGTSYLSSADVYDPAAGWRATGAIGDA